MPMSRQILITCVVAVAVALVVVLVLNLVGLERHATIAAAVSAGVAAGTTATRLRPGARRFRA